MRIMQPAGTPFYPDRAQLTFLGAALTDDITNLCTTVNCGSLSSLAVTGSAAGAVNMGDATVSQATSITTGVTINAASGVITTQSASTAAVTSSVFTVTNSAVAAGSVVIPSIMSYSGTLGTNGSPTVQVASVAGGSFNVVIYNAHATAALAGTFKIGFVVC